MKLLVKVIPKAKKNEIRDFKGGILYVKISAPPVKGKANKELLKFLKRKFEVKDIKIVSGEKSRLKTLDIPLSDKEIFKILHI